MISVLVVFSFFGIFDDVLFFSSDIQSIFWFASTTGLILSLLVSLVTLPYFLVKRGQQLETIPAVIAIGLIITDCIYFFAIGWVRNLKQGSSVLDSNSFRIAIIGLWMVCLILILLWILRSKKREMYAERTYKLATWFTNLSLFAFAMLFGIQKLNKLDSPRHPKRVLLILLDGWPTEYIHTFNPSMKPKKIDDFLNSALVFQNVYTAQPFTYAYFHTLFLGSPSTEYIISQKRNGRFIRDHWNLFSTLQSKGVNTRWLTFHKIGVPDFKGITDYHGFRSVFLSEEYGPLLDALGLQFNALLPTTDNDSMLMNKTRKWLFERLNEYHEYNDPLNDALIPELRLVQKKQESTFLIFHVGWQLGKYSLPAVWQKWTVGEQKQKLLDDIKKRDNRYLPDEEWFAKEVTVENKAIIDTVSEKIIRFFDQANKAKLLENTLVFLVADHGNMSSSGRFWYGFHPNEQATRVPVILFNAEKSGKDERLFETVDVSKTIVDYFGEKNFPNPRAVSLFSNAQKTYTGTLTLRSDLNREWFLIIHKQNLNYQFNLHPKSTGEAKKIVVNHFEATDILESPAVLTEVLPEVKEMMLEYRIHGFEIHSNYRKLVPKELQ